MLSDPLFWLAALLAIAVAGISKGGFGSGAAFAATPIMAAVAGPGAALAILLPILALMDLSGIWAYRKRLNWPVALPLMAASALGVLLGWLTYRWTDEAAVQLLIGVIAIGFLAHRLLGGARTADAAPPRRDRAWRLRNAGFWGSAAGFTSFVAHAGGPLVAMHLIPQKLDKTDYQGVTVLFFWFANVLKFGPYAALGLFTEESLTASLILAPLAPLGVALGVWMHSRVDEALFYRVIYVLLLLSGGRLIWSGVAGLTA